MAGQDRWVVGEPLNVLPADIAGRAGFAGPVHEVHPACRRDTLCADTAVQVLVLPGLIFRATV